MNDVGIFEGPVYYLSILMGVILVISIFSWGCI